MIRFFPILLAFALLVRTTAPGMQRFPPMAGSTSPAAKQLSILRDKGAQLLAMDRTGRLYFRDTVNLWRYAP